MTPPIFVALPPKQAERLAAEEARHRRLAADAGDVDGLPAVDFYRTLTIRQLENVTGDLVPEDDDDEIADRDPRTGRRLRLWHAAWIALEEKYLRQDRRRAAREARTTVGPLAIGGAR